MMREVISLFGNEEAMRKVITSVRKIKKESNASEELSQKEKRAIIADIKEGLKEAKMAEQGKLELREWEASKRELHH